MEYCEIKFVQCCILDKQIFSISIPVCIAGTWQLYILCFHSLDLFQTSLALSKVVTVFAYVIPIPGILTTSGTSSYFAPPGAHDPGSRSTPRIFLRQIIFRFIRDIEIENNERNSVLFSEINYCDCEIMVRTVSYCDLLSLCKSNFWRKICKGKFQFYGWLLRGRSQLNLSVTL